jgi:hypothetical protein
MLLCILHVSYTFTQTLLAHSQAAFFGYGSNDAFTLGSLHFAHNNASCCYTTGYGSSLQTTNANTTTCADVDTGDTRSDCCNDKQYSDGMNRQTCLRGADCSVTGTTLATLSMTAGYWRASDSTTDVRDCWFVKACAGTNNGTVTAVTASTRRTAATPAAVAQANYADKYRADTKVHVSTYLI